MLSTLRKLMGWSPAPLPVQIDGVGSLRFHLHERRPDIWISDPIRRGEVFDAHVLSVVRAFLPRDGIFIDVGANLGWFTVIAGQLAPAGHVVAFEPDADNLALLRSNVRANGLGNVTVVGAAAGAATGTASLFRSPDNQGDHRLAVVSDRAERATVPVTTLSDATANLPLANSQCVLKIDTQGSEVAVLRGAEPLLRAARAARLIIEFWPHGLVSCGASADELIDIFEQHQWRLWRLHAACSVTEVTCLELRALARGEMAPETEFHTDLVAVSPRDHQAIAVLERWQS